MFSLKLNSHVFSGTYITGVDLHITESYMNGTTDSCKKVSFPSSGQLALDIMCGGLGAEKCTPKAWFKFMGNAQGSFYVPFQVNYLPASSTAPEDGFTPLDPKIFLCSESINVS